MGNIVLFILLIIFISLTSGKKKKPAQARKAPPRKPAPAAAKPKVAAAKPPVVKADLPKEEPSEDAPLEGTLEAQETEGETEAEHTEHVRKMQEAEASAMREMQAQRERIETGRSALRTAIILREVLDKPVSLRDE